MNQVKLFLAVMLAVAVMQLYASQERSTMQNSLQDKLLNFKNGIGSYALAREKSPVIQAFGYCIRGCLNETDCLDDQLSYVKKISEFETKLSYRVIDFYELRNIANEIIDLNVPMFYESEAENKALRKICKDIIADHNKDIIADHNNVTMNFTMKRFLEE